MIEQVLVIFKNMHTLCLNLQIRSNKLKCRGITLVYYDMRENLGYMVNISLAFFSRENIFPQKSNHLDNVWILICVLILFVVFLFWSRIYFVLF